MTSNSRRVAYNTIVQVAGRFVTSGIGILTVSLSTRYLGLDLYGQLTVATIYLSIFGTLTDSGTSTITIRELAQKKRPAEVIIGSITVLRGLIASSIALVAVLAGMLIYSHPGDAGVRQAIYILAGQLVLATLQNCLTSTLATKLRNDLIVIGDILGKLVTLAGLVVAVHYNMGFAAIAGAYLLGAVANFASDIFFGLRDIRPRLQFDPKYWKYILALSLPLGAAGILNTLYFRADGFLLSIFRSHAEVGIYGVAYKVVELTMAIPLLFTSTIFPLMASAHEDRERMEALTQKSIRVLSLMAAPVTLGVIALAPETAVLLGGQEFRSAAGPMSILMVGNFFIFVSSSYINALLASNNQAKMLRVTSLSLVLNVAINLIAIPLWGANGAAAAVALTEFAVLFALRRYYRRLIGEPPSLGSVPMPLLAALPMFVVVVLTKPYLTEILHSNILIITGEVILGAVAFAGAAMSLRIMQPRELLALVKR